MDPITARIWPSRERFSAACKSAAAARERSCVCTRRLWYPRQSVSTILAVGAPRAWAAMFVDPGFKNFSDRYIEAVDLTADLGCVGAGNDRWQPFRCKPRKLSAYFGVGIGGTISDKIRYLIRS
jgi:hypothetical protein